jgi:competence protein ComGC
MMSTSTGGIADDAKTSALATTSLVLMILAFFTFGLTALPALIFGIIALVKIEKSNGQLKGKGFAIAGIAAPVVIFPIAMLLAIMMPALGKVKHLAMRQVCGTNIKGLGTACHVYAFDYDDKFPTGAKWCDLLIEHADVGPQSLVCPGALEDEQCNYAMNENIEHLDASSPADIVLLFETGLPDGIARLEYRRRQGTAKHRQPQRRRM